MCLNLKDLKAAIHQDHHRIQTVGEVAHQSTGSCYFTKSDPISTYWMIILDDESSLLTSFSIPLRYWRFLWLPFALVCSQDVLSAAWTKALISKGAMSIANDIALHGNTEEKHDECLCQLLGVTYKYGLKFTLEICNLKARVLCSLVAI